LFSVQKKSGHKITTHGRTSYALYISLIRKNADIKNAKK